MKGHPSSENLSDQKSLSQGSEKQKILIVEDDIPLAETIKESLEDIGYYSVEIVEDGGRALAYIKKEIPDLILLDLMVPVVDGFEVCYRIKQEERFENIPIIIITARDDRDSRIKGFESGADDYLTKPFDSDELILRIERSLKISHLAKELAREKKDVKEEERLKSEFLSNMSHEFCTPINVIIGEAQLLLKGVYGPLSEKQREKISIIENRSEKLLNMVNTLLDIARADAGKMVFTIEEFDIDEMASELADRWKKDAYKKGLVFNLSSVKIGMRSDKEKIVQILDHLLSNAIKFTSSGRVNLKIEIEKETDTVRFIVEDSGIGISEDKKKVIFDEFKRHDPHLVRRYEGMGMGLCLVKRLVGLLRGEIELTSKPGQGSRFTVLLPRRIDHPLRRKEDKF
jgi:signal transduction histidine kinase